MDWFILIVRSSARIKYRERTYIDVIIIESQAPHGRLLPFYRFPQQDPRSQVVDNKPNRCTIVSLLYNVSKLPHLPATFLQSAQATKR